MGLKTGTLSQSTLYSYRENIIGVGVSRCMYVFNYAIKFFVHVSYLFVYVYVCVYLCIVISEGKAGKHMNIPKAF